MNTTLQEIILRVQKDRDQLFIKTYCDDTVCLDKHGNLIKGRCTNLTGQEALNFTHVTIALIFDEYKKQL